MYKSFEVSDSNRKAHIEGRNAVLDMKRERPADYKLFVQNYGHVFSSPVNDPQWGRSITHYA